jgi:hypothetical protein
MKRAHASSQSGGNGEVAHPTVCRHSQRSRCCASTCSRTRSLRRPCSGPLPTAVRRRCVLRLPVLVHRESASLRTRNAFGHETTTMSALIRELQLLSEAASSKHYTRHHWARLLRPTANLSIAGPGFGSTSCIRPLPPLRICTQLLEGQHRCPVACLCRPRSVRLHPRNRRVVTRRACEHRFGRRSVGAGNHLLHQSTTHLAGGGGDLDRPSDHAWTQMDHRAST